MSNQRVTALTQILVLTLGAVVAIAQPVQSSAGDHAPNGIEENLRASLLEFFFPNREERTRGARRSSRAPFDTSVPNMLSPRNTVLLATDELTLQWYALEGATSYTVEVKGGDVDWAVEVTGTEATFDELASLVPDYRYTIVVTSDTGRSTRSEESVGFAILPETESDRVNAQIDAIKAEQLDPDEEALAIALAYRDFEHSDPDWQSYALNQAAIDVLETRIEGCTEDSRVYLLQADTYLRIGLPLLAQDRYQQALAYAEAAEQPELQAESYWGLGDVAQKQAEYEEALAYLQKAKAIYEGLAIEELQTQIEEVERQLPQQPSGQ
jgi:hypothetical protein